MLILAQTPSGHTVIYSGVGDSHWMIEPKQTKSDFVLVTVTEMAFGLPNH